MDKFLIILLFAVFPLGQLDRFNLAGSEVVIHLNDAIVAVVTLLLTWHHRREFLQNLKTDALVKPLGFWLLAILASLAVNLPHLTSRQLLISGLYPLRWFLYAALYLAVAPLPEKSRSLIRPGLIFAGLTVSFVGLLQYIFLPDVSFLKTLDWDDHYYRLVGSFLDPGFTGAILVLALILAVEKILQNPLQKLFWFLSLGVYTTLALTYSRATYLMYLVAFVVISLARRSSKIFLVAALVLFFTLLVLPRPFGEGVRLTRENSAWARLRNWQQSAEIWSKHPLFGVGFNAYRYATNSSSKSHDGAGADSSLLLVAATTGLLGLLSYLYILKRLFLQGRNDLVFIASFFAVLVHSAFNNTLFYPWIMEWLWLLLATGRILK